MELHRAIEVFCEGFTATRSITHPYELRRVGDLWVMEDAPREKGDVRVQEIVTCGLPPKEAVRQFLNARSAKSYLCVVWPMEADMAAETAEYKRLGLRLMGTEPFFLHTSPATPTPSDYVVRRITTEEAALQLKATAGSTQVRPRDLVDEPAMIRQFVAFDADAMIGWVRSVHVSPSETWVSNLFVNPEYRRRGVGRALMSTMLADDRTHGYTHSILLASLTGAMLYPTLGYERIGTLRLFRYQKK